MQKQKKHVLRSDEVELQGRVQIGSTQTRTNSQNGPRKTGAIQQVRLVENNTDFAIVEITCSCGEKTFLKCEYGAAESQTESPNAVAEQAMK